MRTVLLAASLSLLLAGCATQPPATVHVIRRSESPWYLIEPPMRMTEVDGSRFRVPNIFVGKSEWRIGSAHGSGEACERRRVETFSLYNGLARDAQARGDKPGGLYYGSLLARAAMAECLPSEAVPAGLFPVR